MPKRTNGSPGTRSPTISVAPAWGPRDNLHVRGARHAERRIVGSPGQGRRVGVALARMDERPSRPRGQAHQTRGRGRGRGERAGAGPRHGRPIAVEPGDRGLPGARGGPEVSDAVPRVGVVTFPGSLDDRDALRAVEVMGGEAVSLWHRDRDLRGTEAVILPGGFSYGDYLRAGAIAGRAPIMDAVREFAERGGPVVGICNGFQILCEAGLLPGALIRNRSLQFVSRRIHVRVETASSALTSGMSPGDVLELPVKHGEGQFVASPEELDRIEGEGLVAL